MSHELDFSNGRANMAYTGETPWHGLGQRLEQDATMNDWRTAAGMDWRIQRAVVRYATAHGMTPQDYSSIDDRFVLLRSDTKKALGIVSDQYEIVQPAQVLEFFNEVCESAGYRMATAGCLFDGRRFWAMAETGDSDCIGDKRDIVKNNLLLATSADGTLATQALYTSIRVVCNNTLSAAVNAAGAFKVSHKLVFDKHAAQKALGIGVAHEQFANTMASFRQLADTRMEPSDMAMATATLFNPKANELARDELIKLIDSKPVARVLQLAGGAAMGSQFDGAQGTAWAWLNGVTQYVDHEARARGQHAQDNRLASAWFGKGDSTKQKAFEMALQGAGYATRTVYQDAPESLLDAVLSATA